MTLQDSSKIDLQFLTQQELQKLKGILETEIPQDEPKSILWYLFVIVLAALLGGAFNYYFNSSEESSLKKHEKYFKSFISSLIAASTVPLFLNLVGNTEILGESLSNSWKDILVFFGYCLIAASASESFIRSISEKVLKLKEEEVASIAKATQNKQTEIDAKSIELVKTFITDELEEENIKSKEVEEAIKVASKVGKTEIFSFARDYRIVNWEKHPERLDSLFIIFETLIELEDNYKYYAQLGYIYKDSENKRDIRKSIKHLTKAIELRKDAYTLRVYEFNRGLAKIYLRINESNLSDSETQKLDKEIHQDLSIASKSKNWKKCLKEMSEELINTQEIESNPFGKVFREWLEVVEEKNKTFLN